jgi:hypothetical protein
MCAAHTVTAGAGGLERRAARALLELGDALTRLRPVRARTGATTAARRALEWAAATEKARQSAQTVMWRPRSVCHERGGGGGGGGSCESTSGCGPASARRRSAASMVPCCGTWAKDDVSAHTRRVGRKTYTQIALARILDVLGPADADLRHWAVRRLRRRGCGSGTAGGPGYGSRGCWKMYQICTRAWACDAPRTGTATAPSPRMPTPARAPRAPRAQLWSLYTLAPQQAAARDRATHEADAAVGGVRDTSNERRRGWVVAAKEKGWGGSRRPG